jgi:PhnB protein
MTTAVRPIPQGYHSISPSLTCKNAAKAIEFYKNVFAAKLLVNMTGPGGAIMHAELQIGDSHIFLNDEIPGMSQAPSPGSSTGVYIFLYTEDVDSVYNRALAQGAKVTMPLADQFWGDRYGKFTDPFGHNWGVATHVEDVAPEEMKRRQEEMMKQMAKSAGQS